MKIGEVCLLTNNVVNFKGMTSFLGWESVGTIAACDCSTVEDIKKTDFPKQAYEMGKGLCGK